MILQRASSLSCAATSLPQTFATRRFYYHNHSGLPARPLKSTVWVPDSPAHNTVPGCQTVLGCQTVPTVPRTPTQFLRNHHRIQPLVPNFGPRGPSDGRSSPSRSPFARRADDYKLHHRGKRNRRAQPPRLPARVPPVRRSVDPTEPDETTGAPPRRL